MTTPTKEEGKEDIDTGKRLLLIQLLYDRVITIPQFKEYCVKNNLDYNNIEHCCGCAGCYDTEEEYQLNCPDYHYDNCKIVDPKFCNICGKKAEIGYPLEDDNGNEIITFWTCKKHAYNKKLEKDLRKGTSVETIIKKWNK